MDNASYAPAPNVCFWKFFFLKTWAFYLFFNNNIALPIEFGPVSRPKMTCSHVLTILGFDPLVSPIFPQLFPQLPFSYLLFWISNSLFISPYIYECRRVQHLRRVL
jgi:hypothetical protein